MLTIEVNQTDGGGSICLACGELDASTAWQLREVLAERASSPVLLINLSGVFFIDSAGLGALVGGIRRAKELGGDVAIICNRPVINRLLVTTGLGRIVAIVETSEEAMASLEGHPARC
jgi:anti-sigma B factor antagonist